jgi:hypothetical protein
MIWNGNECGKNQGNFNLKGTIPNTNHDNIRNNWRVGNISPIWVARYIMQDVHVKLNLGLPLPK